MEITREHKAGLEKVLDVVESRSLIRKNGMIDGHILQRDLHSWIAQASAAPDHALAEMVKDLAEEAHHNGNSWDGWAKPRMDAILSALSCVTPARLENDICIDGCVIDVHGAVHTNFGIEHENFTVKEVDGKATVHMRGLLISEKVRSCGCAAPEQEPVYQLRNTAVGNVWRDADPEAYEGAAGLAEYERRKLYTRADPSEVEQNKKYVTLGKLAASSGFAARLEEVSDERDAATQRADAAERKLGEVVELLRESKPIVSGTQCAEDYELVNRIDALLSGSAEPAKGGDGEEHF